MYRSLISSLCNFLQFPFTPPPPPRPNYLPLQHVSKHSVTLFFP
jgi:hypothetical protein